MEVWTILLIGELVVHLLLIQCNFGLHIESNNIGTHYMQYIHIE